METRNKTPDTKEWENKNKETFFLLRSQGLNFKQAMATRILSSLHSVASSASASKRCLGNTSLSSSTFALKIRNLHNLPFVPYVSSVLKFLGSVIYLYMRLLTEKRLKETEKLKEIEVKVKYCISYLSNETIG